MRNTEEYRNNAEECRQLAKQALTRSERDQLLELAATWDRLANERQATLAAQPRGAGDKPDPNDFDDDHR